MNLALKKSEELKVESAAPEKLLLIDGSGFIFRAYHSMPPLTRPDGTPVGAVYGFTNMLIKLLESQHATHVAVIFDAARKTFRNDIYADYKAHRPDAPEDLIPQFKLVREATEALNLPAIDLSNFEADDIIATYAKQASAQGMECLIVSSDKDLMQLIDEHVSMYDAMKNKRIASEQVFEKFGVGPDKVIEVQSLIGDSSDNVPGVPGIGPKIAAELINAYGSLEGVLEHAEQIKQPKRRASIIDNTELAKISKELVTLKADCTNIPEITELVFKESDPHILLPFLQEQGFKSLVSRMEQKFHVINGGGEALSSQEKNVSTSGVLSMASQPVLEVEYTKINTTEALREFVGQAYAEGVCAFDIETDSLNPMAANLVGFSMATEEGKACYVPLGHMVEQKEASAIAAQQDLFGVAAEISIAEASYQLAEDQIAPDDALQLIKPLLEDPSIAKIGQNIKYDMLVMKRYGVDIFPIEDTMLLSYVLSAGAYRHNMDDLAERELGVKTISFKDVAGSGKSAITFDKVAVDDAVNYAAEDADITLRLYHRLKPRIYGEGLVSVYERMERALVPAIVQTEFNGIKLDTALLKGLSQGFGQDIAALSEKIYREAGREFNIGSPKQLGEVLFDELGIEGGKKSKKTGAYSTGVEVLDELSLTHDVAKHVLQWRGLSKLKSTYADALPKEVNVQTGRVHTSFSLAATSTGRLSSSSPNLQNIPIRSEDGRKIREAFIAEDGFSLMAADYSQIELRLLAHMAEIEPLKEAFRQGKDIHAVTASQMFGVDVGDVDAEMRRKAKTINFGIIYGISAHGLAMRLGIGRREAAEYIKHYFTQYPGIQAYMEKAKEEAKEFGYVKTLWNRRCHFADINSKNPNRRAFSERAAINAPLQGSAADIIKKAMISVHKMLQGRKVKSRMLLQVHDELIFEIAEDERDWLPDLIRKEMESAAHLSIPLLVDVGIDKNWALAH